MNHSTPTKWLNPRPALIFDLPFPMGLDNGGSKAEIVKQTVFEWLKSSTTSFRQLQILCGVFVNLEPNQQLTRQVRPDHVFAEWGEQPIIHQSDMDQLNAEWLDAVEEATARGVVLSFTDYTNHFLPTMLAFEDAETDTEWPTPDRINRRLRYDKLLLQYINEQ